MFPYRVPVPREALPMSSSQSPARRRSKKYVHARIQGGVALRILLYWLACGVVATAMIITWRVVVSGPARVFYTHFDDLWFRFHPVIVASLLLLPLVLFDMLRFTHRVVGPMIRLRSALEALGRGEKVQPLQFRSKDHWHELAEGFNRALERVRDLEEQLQRQQPEGDADEPAEALAAGRADF